MAQRNKLAGASGWQMFFDQVCKYYAAPHVDGEDTQKQRCDIGVVQYLDYWARHGELLKAKLHCGAAWYTDTTCAERAKVGCSVARSSQCPVCQRP